MQAIFLLGSERSGSNLLRTLLGNHSQISAPIAPHLSLIFMRYFRHYMPFKEISKRNELLADINSFVNHPFHDWNIKFNLDQVEDYRLNSFIDFVHYSYSQYTLHNGKDHYFSKDNNNHDFALGILKDIPKAKFIYLYRDPRDQVASWMRTPIHIHTPYAAIRKWIDEQTNILYLRDFFNVDMHLLKYENLVDNPEKEMEAVLNYLKLPIERNCFQTRRDNKEAEKHPLWKNINKPIRKSNHNKYKDILSLNDLDMIETLAMPLMKQLNYQPETEQNWKKNNSYLFNFNQKLKTKKSIKKHYNFIEREMAILNDKNRFIDKMFSKFK